MYDNLRERWWALPLLSSALLILSFHPFNLWALSFVALVPLYYFAAGFGHTTLRLFWGGFLVGSIFAFSLSYFTLLQFHWLPEARLFATLVHLLVVPITLLSGCTVGALTALWAKYLYSPSPLLNALVGGALYTLAELVLSILFGGYYLAHLGYAALPVPGLRVFASVGGAGLLSFIVALCNGFIAGVLVDGRKAPFVLARAGAVLLCALIVVGTAEHLYLSAPSAAGELKVAIVQAGKREDIVFGTQKAGVFTWTETPRLGQATGTPDLVIYPFSPVEGALYRGTPEVFNKNVLAAGESEVGKLFANTTHSTVLTWNNVYADGKFYNEYEVWQGGRVVSEYKKRALFPFMDYTPQWAQNIGLYSTPFDVVPGAAEGSLPFNDLTLGALMCSEIHDTALARSEARRAPAIIAVGSEAMFQDSVASAFSLRAAQARAAENNVPVVRANILGPSAIIDRSGAIVAMGKAGERTIVEGTLSLAPARSTLYNRLGDAVIWLLIFSILGSAWYASRAKRLA